MTLIAARRASDPVRVGRFRVVGVLGTGGMGTVYAALGERGERVAVKVVHAAQAADEQFRARFRPSPLRHLHRTIQRCGRRPRLPGALPLRGLRTLPHRRLLPPDLEAYLADLLRNRERLAAFANAGPWAKAEATPSDDEIAHVRRLVQRVRQDLDDLTDEDRAQIREAVAL